MMKRGPPFHSTALLSLSPRSLSHSRRVAVRAAKLQDQVGIGALVEDSILAAGVARAVSVGAVTAVLAGRARDAVAVAGAAGEELEALGLEGVAEDGAQVVVGAVRVGALVVDGLQRAAEVGLARDGDGGLLDVRARDADVEGVVGVGGQGDDAGGGVALLGLEVEWEGALVVDKEGGCRGGGGEAGEHEGGEVHGCCVGCGLIGGGSRLSGWLVGELSVGCWLLRCVGVVG